MSVVPCLLYNSDVRSSTSVLLLDTEVLLLLAHLFGDCWRLQHGIMN